MQFLGFKHWLLLAVSGFVLLASNVGAANDEPQLNNQEQKVLDYLLKDWGEDFSVTSVHIAMAAVKAGQSDETRFRIGSYIKAHPELHEVVRRWGWVTLVLTPEEKLLARALINAERDGRPEPSTSDLAKAAAMTEAQVRRGLSTLVGYEILQQNSGTSGAGYKVAARYLKWEPRLDFVFHKVTLDSGHQFNTN
jgi:hypothetical protein